MPVSKKRKKGGKPVQRAPATPAGETHPDAPETHASHPQQRMGKPTNPFVGQHQSPRSAQRGR